MAPADVDGDAAATRAMELYDANANGGIDAAEAAKCPPLASGFAAFDKDSDSKVTSAELSDRIAALARGPLTSVECTVTFNGRPLAGATVKMQPAEFYDGALPPAEGQSDETGAAQPTIDTAGLPAHLANAQLMHPGLYRVEIAHPQTTIPARYNTATELAYILDPFSRTGATARFDLKP